MANENEEVEHRYVIRRPNGMELVIAGTQKKAIDEARYLATHQDETVMVFMLVGSVTPPKFKQDEYEPL